MGKGRSGTSGRRAAGGIVVAGAVGLALLAAPAGAGAAPVLPPVPPEDLVASVLAADPGAFGGTVELHNALGLPPLPDLPQLGNATFTARIWSDGEERGRVQLPTDSGERTIVADGETLWAWNSADRTVTKVPATEAAAGAKEVRPEAAGTDPAAAATEAIGRLRATSVISVDGTAEVAGRPAYELVLAPAPTERTLLREVRIAVDAQNRVPLRLTVLANGSSDPVLTLGFTELTLGPQDPALFSFTPPPGATVTEAERREGAPPPAKPEAPPGFTPTVVGDGWDTVVIAPMRAPGAPLESDDRFGGGAVDPSTLGTPVSGPWGSGRLITTAVANAIITDDERIAVGAVPEQVLTEALSR